MNCEGTAGRYARYGRDDFRGARFSPSSGRADNASVGTPIACTQRLRLILVGLLALDLAVALLRQR